jgi:hypothetical protein
MISRRGMVGAAAAALGGAAMGRNAQAKDAAAKDQPGAQFPSQLATDRSPSAHSKTVGGYDMRDDLKPRRLTMAMWDAIYFAAPWTRGQHGGLRPSARRDRRAGLQHIAPRQHAAVRAVYDNTHNY